MTFMSTDEKDKVRGSFDLQANTSEIKKYQIIVPVNPASVNF